MTLRKLGDTARVYRESFPNPATERRDVLSGLFYLLAILVYLRACERGERGRGWYWGAVGLFAGALLSKSMVVNLPVVLLILDVYPLRCLGGASGWWSEPTSTVKVHAAPLSAPGATIKSYSSCRWLPK